MVFEGGEVCWGRILLAEFGMFLLVAPPLGVWSINGYYGWIQRA